MKRQPFPGVWHWAIVQVLISGFCHAQQVPPITSSQSAHFRVTADVINENVLPFAATIGGVGNSFINEGGGFEPIIFRNKYVAIEDSPSRIFVAPAALSQYDSWGEGFLDQAVVHVYRIESGRFKMVREDRVAKDGFHVSGWNSLIGGDSIIAPNSPRFVYQWKSWNRPRVKDYFTVRALDKRGRLSPSAIEFAIARPDDAGKGEAVNSLVELKQSRLSVIANKITGDSSSLPAPKNLKGKIDLNGRLTLHWDPIDDDRLAGYIVYRSDYPSSAHKGFFLQLTGVPISPDQHVKAGDMIIVSKKFFSASRDQFLSNRVWGAEGEYRKLLPGLIKFFPDEDAGKSWQLMPHEQNTVVEEPGETYLKLKLARGVKESLYTYNHSGSSQHWYDVLEQKTYRVEVWMRQEGAGSVRFTLGGIYDRPPKKIEPIEFKVGSNWRKYVATFTIPSVHLGAEPGNMGLEFTGPGIFHIDNFRVYRADTGYLDLLPEDYEAIRSSHLLALRTHGWISTKNRNYDIEQLTNSEGAISGSREKPNTLPQMLKIMRKVKVDPWLQVEFHMSPQEWLAFVEYLAAPYDPKVDSPQTKPWAHKRYAQGQLRPWVDEFGRIYLELSNETWNRIFAPWTFDSMTDAVTQKKYTSGQVYGLFQEYVISLLRGSPYWQQANLDRKFKFVLGGWGGRAYGADAAIVSPSSDLMSIAAYNGGWDEKEGPSDLSAAGFFDVLAQVSQTAIPVADRHVKEVEKINADKHGKLRLGTYEAGPGYALNGLNNARVTKEQKWAQEQVMKSLASGTATLDSFLARTYRGFEIQNFFTFGRGDFWKSHAKLYDGGQAYPSWKAITLFNREGAGDMLRTETLSVPTAELRAFNQRQAIKDGPLVAVYATQKSNRFNLFVLSRKILDNSIANGGGFTPVTVELPFGRANTITLYRMAGDPREHNLYADNVKVEKLAIPPFILNKRFTLNRMRGATEGGLPPASTYLYVFEGIQ